jgi:hypothetical protein
MKIYEFMQKSNEEKIKQRDSENAFAEENKLEKDRQHKALIAAITGKPITDKEKQTAEKIEGETGTGVAGVLSDILGAFGGAKTAISLLTTLGGLVASPLGVALIGAVVAGTIGAWMYKQIEADPQAALEGKGGIGMAVAGLGSEGQLPSYDAEQEDKQKMILAAAVDKKGIKAASIPELEAKKDLLVSYGKAKSPEVTELVNEIKSRKMQSDTNVPPTASPVSNTTTGSPTSSSPVSESPASVPAASQKLSQVQSENLDLSIPKSKTDPATVVNNNSVKSYDKTGTKITMPSVRNQEPTFQSMILFSTRVV